MRNRNKLRPAMALLLVAAMALTEPAQSMTSVQAVEMQEGDSIVSEEESVAELMTETLAESDGETLSSIETSFEQVDTEEDTLKSDIETAEGVDENTEVQESQIDAGSEVETIEEEDTTQEVETEETIEEEDTTQEVETEETIEEEDTIQEETTEGSIQEETEEEETTEELLLSTEKIENAVTLSVNKKEQFIIKREEENSWYSFTPGEDGTYILKMTFGLNLNDDDYWCFTSGLNQSLNFDVETNKASFTGKEGKTVYFKPYVYDNVWEDYEIEEIVVSLTILRFPDKEEAVPLSDNIAKKFAIQRGEECSWYSFTPKEDGAYALDMFCDGLDYDDYWCTTSGLNSSFSIEGVSYKTIFIGKAGETVYFQPYVPNYV